LIVRIPIAEGSAKVRSGGPLDEGQDLALPVWAGEVPISLVTQSPIPDAGMTTPMALPSYLADDDRRR
jgi:hypothetical protein